MNEIPDKVLEKASEMLRKKMGVKDKQASKKIASSLLHDCISVIESLGGKVIWKGR